MQTNIGTDAFTLQIKVIEARCVYRACQNGNHISNGKDAFIPYGMLEGDK